MSNKLLKDDTGKEIVEALNRLVEAEEQGASYNPEDIGRSIPDTVTLENLANSVNELKSRIEAIETTLNSLLEVR